MGRLTEDLKTKCIFLWNSMKISPYRNLFLLLVGTTTTVVLLCFLSKEENTVAMDPFLMTTRNRRVQQCSIGKTNKTSMKNSPYDNLDLYVRMTTRDRSIQRYYKKLLVQSMEYFWPDNPSMVVVLDGEYEPDHEFGEAARHYFPFPKVCYMEEVKGFNYSGKDRMQRDMFYPDKCTNKTYVGYVDTDTMFITKVVPEMLFEGDKPIIIGIYGNLSVPVYEVWANATRNIFKTKEVMRCMSSFPVIVKVQHMVQLRKYLQQLHNTTFDKILPLHTERWRYMYSQFHFICQYIWMFHRDEYKFHLQFLPQTPLKPSSAREDPEYYAKVLTSSQTEPFPRSSVHYTIYDLRQKEATYRMVLKVGMCHSGGFKVCPAQCREFKNDSLHKELFKFEFNIDWAWDKRCYKAQIDHYNRVSSYTDENYLEVIRLACFEIDFLNFP